MSLPQSYRQYRLAQPGSLSADNFKIQETKCAPLKANEVAVKIHAVSLNFRDIEIANNTYAAKTKTNLVPCSDMAGEIVSVGSDVRCWKQGQRVYASFALDHLYGDTSPQIADTYLGSQNQDGVLAEYRNFPEHSLVEIPDYLSYEEASTIPCSALTAYNCLLGAKPLKGGDYVLILGTGGVSVFAIQIAVASGATALVVSSSDDKLKTAQKLGAQHVINYEKVQDWAKEIHKITGGRGVDHVIEVGGAGTLRQSLEAVRYGGYVHLVGYVTHKGEQTKDSIGLEEMLTKAIFKTVNLRGIQIGSVAQFQDMNRLFAAKCIKPVVDKVFNFDDVVSAYKYFESQKHEGKVVIRVGK